MRHRVLLVEDDDETRARIAGAIQAEPRLVLAGVAASCVEARAVLAVSPPDVLVTDLSLPDGHGTELIREARAARQIGRAHV